MIDLAVLCANMDAQLSSEAVSCVEALSAISLSPNVVPVETIRAPERL